MDAEFPFCLFVCSVFCFFFSFIGTAVHAGLIHGRSIMIMYYCYDVFCNASLLCYELKIPSCNKVKINGRCQK